MNRFSPCTSARPARVFPLRAAVAAGVGILSLAAAALPAHGQRGGGVAAGALTEKQVQPFKARLVGPANTSGRITALAVPSDGRVVYAATAGGGVWKTVNRGTTWQSIWDDQPFASIGDVAVAPSDSNVVWVGTGERNSLRSQGWGDGVYRSTDGGKSWSHMGLRDTREIGRIAIHPRDPNTVYVAAMGHLWGANRERGVFKTTDGGKSWSKVLFVNDTTGFVDLKMDPSNPEVLYAAGWHRLRWGGGRMEGAGAGSGIFKTTDGGSTWRELTDPRLGNGLPTRNLGRIGLAVYPRDPRILYAVIQAAQGNREQGVSQFGGVFRSDNAGESWTRVHDISAVPDYYYNEVYVDPNDPDKVWLNGTYLMHSKDGGKTFARFDLGKVHVDHHDFWIDPRDSRHMILGNDGGVHISYDAGDTWSHELIPVTQFYEVSVDSTKVPYHVCGGLQDNGTWCGPSQTREEVGITPRDWYAVFGGDGMHSAVDPTDPNIRYVEYQFGSISRFDARTGEYTSIQPEAEDAGPESGHAFRWDWTAPFVISRHDPRVIYLGGNFLFKLTDRGDNWEILGPDMTRQSRANPEPQVGHTSYGALFSISESPLDRNVIWTGSDDGLIWTTTDAGRTWRRVSDAIPSRQAQQCWVSEIEASHHDVRTAYVTYDCHMRDDYRPYVFRTTDGGRSWTSIAGNLPEDGATYVVREDFVNPRLLYVGTERGLYLSSTGGGQWVRLKNGLPTAAVRDMDFAYAARDLVIGTMGRGIFILDIAPLQQLTAETLARPVALLAVDTARLFNQIDTYESFADEMFTAPNPPRGAVITYLLREDQGKEVTLTIRGPGGADEVVQTLTGSGEAGVHQVIWNLQSSRPRPRRLGDPTSPEALRRVLPGTYQVELRVGETRLTQPIVVEEGWVEKTPGRLR